MTSSQARIAKVIRRRRDNNLLAAPRRGGRLVQTQAGCSQRAAWLVPAAQVT